MNLKRKYWNDALFNYDGKTKRISFHSREIRNRREAFNPSLIDYESFIVDLSQLMADLPLTIYASHIDKLRHVQQYAYPEEREDEEERVRKGMLPEHQSEGNVQGAGEDGEEVSELADREGEGAGDDQGEEGEIIHLIRPQAGTFPSRGRL